MEYQPLCYHVDDQRIDYIDEDGEVRYEELDMGAAQHHGADGVYKEVSHGLTHKMMEDVNAFVYEMSHTPACARLYAAMQEAIDQQWVHRAQKYHKEFRQALSAACRHEFLFDGHYQTGRYTYAIERLNQLYPPPFADKAPLRQLGGAALQRAVVPRSQHGYYDDVKLRAANDRSYLDDE